MVSSALVVVVVATSLSIDLPVRMNFDTFITKRDKNDPNISIYTKICRSYMLREHMKKNIYNMEKIIHITKNMLYREILQETTRRRSTFSTRGEMLNERERETVKY